MDNSCMPGSRSPDVCQDYGPLPNLLTTKAQNVVKLKGCPNSVALAYEKHSAMFGVNKSKPVADAHGQSTVVESATVDSAKKKEEETKVEANAEMKSFVDVKHKLTGASVEYYSKSYGEWIPAIVADVRANACLTLLHADGSVLKLEADPDSVRVAPEQARQDFGSKQNYESLAEFNTSFGDGAMEHSFSEDSKEVYDEQMKLLHRRSEKLNAQLKIHRGLSEGMVQDQQLELSHLKFRHNLGKALGRDTTHLMHSSDERRAAHSRKEWLKILNDK
jgi:hypothetical protein